MKDIVQIRTLDELKKVLFIQKTVADQAKHEMAVIASDAGAGAPAEFILAERQLLEKYINYPTLTEFALMPHLADMTKWGATFGVTVLVAGLVLEEVKHLQPKFDTLIRPMFMLLMDELDQPKHKHLITPLEQFFRVQMEAALGQKMSSDDAQAYIRKKVYSLIESFIMVCAEYGLVTSSGKGFSITPTGRRVLLHLMDAQKFIAEMGQAHARFQTMKPKLSVA